MGKNRRRNAVDRYFDKKRQKITQTIGVTALSVIALAIGLSLVPVEDEMPKVFRSQSTGEIVRVEKRGVEIPLESVSGGKYKLVWVE